MLAHVRTFADRLIGLSAIIGSLGLVLEVAVILADVIGRYFGNPLTGGRDVAQMTMVIVVFGGMALCDRSGGHISVDLLERYFPPVVNRMIDAFAALLGAVIFAVMAWAVYDSSLISRMLHLSTNLLNLPKAWFQWALVAFALVTAIGMLARAIELALGRPDIRHERHPT